MRVVANGLCECGCGEATRVATETSRRDGTVAGVPLRFVRFHHHRMPRRGGPDYVVDHATGCWEWQHGRDERGYGRTTAGGREVLAYRAFYAEAHGEPRAGLDLDHLCRNPGCVNPDHLEPVTHAENVRRGASARLSWDDVFEIRASSDSYRSLARRFGVSNCAISNVKNHKTWVEDESTPGRR